MSKSKLKGIIFILIGAFFFGAQGVFSVKAINAGLGSTLDVAYLKLFYGVIALILLNIFFGKINMGVVKSIFKRENRFNVLMSTLSIMGVNAFIMIGYRDVGPALGIVYLYSSIFFTIFLSRLVSREKITLNKILGGIFIILGLVVVYLGGNSTGSASAYGVGMCLLGGISMSFYNIYGKKNLANFSTLNHNLIQLAFALALMSFLVNPKIIASTITMPGNFWVVLLGIIVFAVAYPLFGIGLAKIESSISGIISSSEIIYSAVLAFIVFNEKLSHIQIAGIIFVMAAIIINSVEFNKKNKFMAQIDDIMIAQNIEKQMVTSTME